MPTMWKCIIINILSQIIGLGRTIYYIADPSMDCKYSHVLINTKLELKSRVRSFLFIPRDNLIHGYGCNSILLWGKTSELCNLESSMRVYI